jgi:hypothetical protein
LYAISRVIQSREISKVQTLSERFSVKGQELIELLCSIAERGLAACYSQQNLHAKQSGLNNCGPHLSMPWNTRYIIIAQIGIKRWQNSHNCGDGDLPDLWQYIRSKTAEIKSAGDLGLATWAGVETGTDDCWMFLERLVKNWPSSSLACNAVELAWVVQGLVRISQYGCLSDKALDVLRDAQHRLVELYCPANGLFARHNRRGFKEMLSRKIACFADQVYPIMALANYGATFNDSASIYIAVSAADTICRLQGPKGEWWWHYNAESGIVAEEYPVFSVHQEAMAPMALLAIDAVAGTDHSQYIEKGLSWLNAPDAVRQTMIVPKANIVWRDVHRREIHKMYRAIRGALVASRLLRLHRLTGKNLFGYVINKECRPYELGWILYAWA